MTGLLQKIAKNRRLSNGFCGSAFKKVFYISSSREEIQVNTERAFKAFSDCSFLDGSQQLIGDIRVFKPHDALFRMAEAQKVDAPVPDNFLIEHRKFLMDVRFEHHSNAGGDQ